MDEVKKDIMYANHVAMTVGPVDSFLTFRWRIPSYDKTGNVDGGQVLIQEITVSSPTPVLIDMATKVLDIYRNNISVDDKPASTEEMEAKK